ncbi:hypothetical protein [uncultured Clostridium sp.]|nr:hypothetical protein [uncultured Clostridium sp.]
MADTKLDFLCIKVKGPSNNKESIITPTILKFSKLKCIRTCGMTIIR